MVSEPSDEKTGCFTILERYGRGGFGSLNMSLITQLGGRAGKRSSFSDLYQLIFLARIRVILSLDKGLNDNGPSSFSSRQTTPTGFLNNQGGLLQAFKASQTALETFSTSRLSALISGFPPGDALIGLAATYLRAF